MNQYKTEEKYEEAKINREEYSILQEAKPQEKDKQKLKFEETWAALPVSGGIYSSPIFNNDVIYFGSLDKHLYALTEDGKMLWKFVTGDVIVSSPTIYNDTIYFGSGDGYFYALNMEGKIKWKFLTGNKIVSTPIIIEDKIYFGSGDGYFYCLTLDGRLVWKFLTGYAITNSPSTSNDMVFFGSWDGNFYALDKNSGKLIWKFLCGSGVGGAGTPVVVNENFNMISEFRNRIYKESPKIKSGIIYVGSQDNNLYALTLNGKMLWKFLADGSIPTSSFVSNKRLYFGSWDCYFYCINAENGKELWKFRAGGPITSLSIVYKNKVYVCSHDYSLYVFDEYGKLLWQFRTGGNVGLHPIIINDIIYFGSLDSHFYAIDINERSVKWTFSTGLGTQAEKLKEIVNLVIDFDRKIFKTWRPETTRLSTSQKEKLYKLPDSSFTFAGEHAYKSSSPYISRRKGSYESK